MQYSSLRIIFSSLLAAGLAACAPSAKPIEDCPAGSVEANGVCVVACNSNRDCLQAEICMEGRCVPGRRPDSGVSDDDGGPERDAGPGGDPDAAPDAGDAEPPPPPDAGVQEGATLSATSLNFGTTVIGDMQMRQIMVTNDTMEEVAVRFGQVTGPQAGSFSVRPASGTARLPPGMSTTLTFTYSAGAPAGAAMATYELDLCDGGCTGQVQLQANAVLDPISCTPTNGLDFGLVNAGSSLTLSMTCTNDSDYDTAIQSWALSGGSSTDFALGAGPGFPITLLPGQSQQIDVTYSPDDSADVDSGMVAITIDHPNPSRATLVVPVTGRAGGQNIECTPAMLDMGFIGAGSIGRQAVTCRNRGNVPLVISSARAQGGQAGEFRITAIRGGSTTGFPVSLTSGQQVQVVVNLNATTAGMRMTNLMLASNDRDQPMLNIPVTAQVIDTTGCMATVSPDTLDFGNVALGATIEQDIQVQNNGTGPCAISLIGLSSEGDGIPSPFSIVTMNRSVMLVAGGLYRVTISFTPSAAMTSMDNLLANVSNVMGGQASLPLRGIGYAGNLSVSPTTVDFGVVPVGCRAPTIRPVVINNSGAPRVSLSSIRLDSGAPAFLVASATTSVGVPDSGSTTIQVGFAPTMAGSIGGRLRVEADTGEVFFVQLRGEGRNNANNVTTVPPPATRNIDVLFVINNSGTMSEEQRKLRAAASQFTNAGDAARADYHIGVVTTDGSTNNIGRLVGAPRFVERSTPDRTSALAANLNPGTNGPMAQTGLGAARSAVTDATLLAGPNAGFLRADADLHIVVLSDAEDATPGTVQSLVMDMANRTTGNTGVTVHAITGGPSGCLALPATNAGPEQRYQQAVTMTSGLARSICSDSYGPPAMEIARAIFGDPRNVVQLGSRPAPGTLQVSVDGAMVMAQTGTTTNYYVDNVNPRVVFPAPLTPQPTSTVEVRFEAYCAQTTCGDGMPNPGEQCDDGNMVSTDACTNDCYLASCGDTWVRANVEQCDDGNTIPNDGCDSVCDIEGCGNGRVDPGEQCDDGMLNSDTVPNACRTDCTNPSCGDGVPDMGETCDDGNQANTDACTNACAAARCGDTFVQYGVEQCDDGNVSDTDACNSRCRYTVPALVVTSAPLALVPMSGQANLNFVGAGNPTDNGVATVSIGFPFTFLGRSITDIYVSANGWISLFPSVGGFPGNARFPNPNPPNSLVAWWWDDLDFSASNVPEATTATTRIDGVVGSRIRTVTFQNVATRGPGVSYYLLNAQVRLFEATGRISVHYGRINTVGTNPNDFSASAGWEDGNGITGLNILGCGSTCTVGVWPTDTVFNYDQVP